ncbi:MAG TPA: transporter [Acetobacteraceae bacterium]|nr:transporter [Acetobacteraceae bacterium]
MLRIIRLGMCLAAIGASGPVFAGSIQEPGETAGVALGPPLPPGAYFVNFLNYGVHDSDPRLATTVDIPILLWSTPWTLLNGRVSLGVSTPLADANVSHAFDRAGWYYPEIIYGLGWNLTPHLSASLIGATYFPVNDALTHLIIGDRGTSRFGGALTYSADNWTLSAYTQYGIPYGTDSTVAGGAHDWLNVDLTAMRAIGKLQLGIVGYGSADTTSPYNGYRRQNQIALGPLVGYDFGPLTVQMKLTTEIDQANYGGRDTRVWTNLILPLRF